MPPFLSILEAAAPVAGGLFGLVGNLFGSHSNRNAQQSANEANLQAVRETNRANRELAEYAYSRDLEMWNRQNQYNSPSAQMERLKAAGLNPNLVYGHGAVGNVSSAIPRYQVPQVQTPNYKSIGGYDVGDFGFSAGLSAYQSLLNAGLTEVQTSATEETAYKTSAERRLTESKQKEQDIRNASAALKLDVDKKTKEDILKSIRAKAQKDIWDSKQAENKYNYYPQEIHAMNSNAIATRQNADTNARRVDVESFFKSVEAEYRGTELYMRVGKYFDELEALSLRNDLTRVEIQSALVNLGNAALQGDILAVKAALWKLGINPEHNSSAWETVGNLIGDIFGFFFKKGK